jgi:hypothetical protein
MKKERKNNAAFYHWPCTWWPLWRKIITREFIGSFSNQTQYLTKFHFGIKAKKHDTIVRKSGLNVLVKSFVQLV